MTQLLYIAAHSIQKFKSDLCPLTLFDKAPKDPAVDKAVAAGKTSITQGKSKVDDTFTKQTRRAANPAPDQLVYRAV